MGWRPVPASFGHFAARAMWTRSGGGKATQTETALKTSGGPLQCDDGDSSSFIPASNVPTRVGRRVEGSS